MTYEQCDVKCKWCKEHCIGNKGDHGSKHFCVHAEFDDKGMVTKALTVGSGFNSSNSYPGAR